jgi:release factor glutamine methyltransferase
LTTERWTVLKTLSWTQDYLRGKGIPNPRLEGELLLSHVLGCDRVGLYLRHDMMLSPDELTNFGGVLRRRASGEPLPYITGYQEFWSIRFKVNSHVLIPRPETETLVEEALRLIEAEGWAGPRILEAGTGCGAIAIAIARTVPSARIVATEVSWGALTLARENALAQAVETRVHFVQGDVFSFIRCRRGGDFDLVVSNPPYVKTEDIENLQREIRDFEPRGAIDGGSDGLHFHRQLLAEGLPRLRPGGWLVIEIGNDQREGLLRLAEKEGGFKRVRIVQDYSGRNRTLLVQRNGR